MQQRALVTRLALTFLLASAAVAPLYACFPRGGPPARPFTGEISPQGTEPFAIVGDLQTTSVLEFWREENDIERERVVQRIAASRPAFLVMLGDLVSNGSSAAEWADFDTLCEPLREARVPVLAVPGNHEYWMIAGDLRHFTERFPHIDKRTYSTVKYGSLALILLNSNKDRLSAWDAQAAWYREELRRLDADPDVQSVLVMTHHPPYTNSTVTGDEEHVQEAFVPAFKASRKTLAMISGHVHSYERFIYEDKAFVVSGGGGGPRAELLTGSDCRHPEDRFSGPAIRAFHYLSVKPLPAGLEVEVIGLSDDGGAFSTIDSFKLPWVI